MVTSNVTPPVYVNELGTKWWPHEDMYSYDALRDIHAVDYGYKFWIVETADGFKTFLITKGSNIQYQSTSSEAIAVRIDIIKMFLRKELDATTDTPGSNAANT